jgi:DNA-binding transcriptional LysR family regulator
VALLDQAKEIEDLLNGKSGFGSLAVGATLTIGNYLATLLIGSFMQATRKARSNCMYRTLPYRATSGPLRN